MASKCSLNTVVSNFIAPLAKKAKLASTLTAIRSFKDSWKIDNGWLRYDPASKLMFCDLCVKCKKQNSFTTGCSVMKRESVTKHGVNKGKNHL